MAVGLGSLCPAAVITLEACLYMAEYTVPLSTNLIIGLSIFSTIVIASTALAILIDRNTEVKGMQNPKDWKIKILNQKTSKQESCLYKAESPLENIPSK